MSVTAQRITVSTTAVALNAADEQGGLLMLKNVSANAADLGPAGVTAGTGYDLAAAQLVTIQLDAGDILYAIRSAASDAIIAVLRV
jgi:hypothetical protein